MVSGHPHHFFFLIFVAIYSLLANNAFCFNVFESGLSDAFSSGLATWYGPDTGPGSGGACGWGDDVGKPPYNGFIAAGNRNIFLAGKGCGNCYEILCNESKLCSGKAINVTISDECPGACNNVPFHFDLSGMAFGAMANHGEEAALRKLGQVNIQYKRVPCDYKGAKIAFKIDPKDNPYYFDVAIENVNGDGGLKSVEVATACSPVHKPMQNTWGANWRADIDPSFKPPFSFKLTSPSGKTIEATNAIPVNFALGALYTSNVNF